MGVYVQKQHTPAQLAALQRRVVDTIIAGKPPHGFNMRAFHSQPPKGSELDWFVGRHLYYHMRAADRGELLTGGPMQRLRRVRLRSQGEVAGEGEGEYFIARESMADEAGATLVSSWEARQRQAGAAAPMNQLDASRPPSRRSGGRPAERRQADAQRGRAHLDRVPSRGAALARPDRRRDARRDGDGARGGRGGAACRCAARHGWRARRRARFGRGGHAQRRGVRRRAGSDVGVVLRQRGAAGGDARARVCTNAGAGPPACATRRGG